MLARLLDDAIPIPGTGWRIGIDPLIGLVPGIGDVLGAVASAWILVVASRLGAPGAVIARMGWNVAIDTVLGTIPVAGDLFDAGWKSNAKNVALLERWLERPGPARRSSAALVAAIAFALLVALAGTVFLLWQVLAWAAHRIGAG